MKPTPRGGGVAIVISVLMALLYSYISQFISLNDFFHYREELFAYCSPWFL